MPQSLQDDAVESVWAQALTDLKNLKPCGPGRIAELDRDSKTLTPVYGSACPKKGCQLQYTTDAVLPGAAGHAHPQRWADLHEPVEITYKDEYDPTHLPNNVYIEVRCMCGGRRSAWTMLETALPNRRDHELPVRDAGDALGGIRNFVSIKFDALSRTRATKYMPKYIDLIRAENNKPEAERRWTGFMMGSYHTVGYQTSENEIPHFAGRRADHWQWKCCRGFFPHKIQNWIWGDFKKAGWKIGYGSQNCLNVMGYCQGFSDAHTTFDYLFRGIECNVCPNFAYWRTPPTRHACLGNIPAGVEFVRFIADALEAERGHNRVAFFTDFIETHNMKSPMTAAHLEDAAVEAVELLMNDVDDTLVVLYGDHGQHYGPLFQTAWGTIDHRLPNMQILAPQWWLDEHPDVKDALTMNQHQIITNYDMHATMHHMLAYPKPFSTIERKVAKHMDSVGRSILEPLGAEHHDRACGDAGLAPEYCVLQNSLARHVTEEDLGSTEYKEVVDAAISAINAKSAAFRSTCREVSIKNGDRRAAFVQGTVTEIARHGNVWSVTFQVRPFNATFVAEVVKTSTAKPGGGVQPARVVVKMVKQTSLYKRYDTCRPQVVPKGFCLCDEFDPDEPTAVITHPSDGQDVKEEEGKEKDAGDDKDDKEEEAAGQTGQHPPTHQVGTAPPGKTVDWGVLVLGVLFIAVIALVVLGRKVWLVQHHARKLTGRVTLPT